MRSLLHTPRTRKRSIAAATIAALALIGSFLVASPAQALSDTGTGGIFVPVAGARIADNVMTGKQWTTIQVAGKGSVPADGSAGAVSVVATLIGISNQGILSGRPNADKPSTVMGIYGGENKQNTSFSAVLAVNSDGTIQVSAETNARLLLDVQGYYTSNADGTAAGGFVPMNGSRIVDTRNGTGAPKAPLTSGKTVDLQVGGVAGVPNDASAVIVNMIAANTGTTTGYFTPYPTGSTRPPNSFNYAGNGVATSMQAQVKLSSTGKLTVFNQDSTADLVLDIQGYFTAAGKGGAVFTPGAGRAYDTRTSGNTVMGKNETRSIQIAGTAGVPVMGSGVNAVVLTLTSLKSTAGSGNATVWADGTTRPNTTSINFDETTIRTNTITVPLGANGKIAINNVADPTNYVFDVQGWYADPKAPSISCPQPYASGSWTKALPAGDITCTVKTGQATDSDSVLAVSVDGNTLDQVALNPTTATTQTVIVPGSGGEHNVQAIVTFADSSTSANAYGFGFGDWASSALAPFPVSGGPGYVAGALSVAPIGSDQFGSDASFKYTISTNADGKTNPIVSTDWVRNGYTIPAGTLVIGTTYYWTVDIEGTSGGSDTASFVHSPVYSFNAADTVTASNGQQVSASAVLAASSPLDASDATFDDNKSLSVDEVSTRNDSINAQYNPGDALSADDLEFMRIYAFKSPSQAPATSPMIRDAVSKSFDHTKSAAGVKARFYGKLHENTGTISNSWSCSVTTSVTGRFKSIKSGCEAQGFGAIAQYPFIGKVYESYPTATGTKSPYSFATNKAFSGLMVYVTVQPTTTVSTANGQFSMNANG